ncbi:MAG: metallophosphoesterase family protein [Nanoarchaeota archaeon]|nr:metallophosphoesterase family protein [Nanoarchaeota archaeon]
MKILAFVDTHGNMEAIKRLLLKGEGVDLIVCAGDISNFGNNLKGLVAKFQKLKTPMLIIHGNHESEEQMKELAKEFPWLIFLHKGSYQINGYCFFGYGGGGFSTEDLQYEKTASRFRKTLKKDVKLVIITHGPPYGTRCDFLSHQGHRGCRSYTKIDKELKPVLHICGHLHETASMRDRIGDTLVINPGAEGKIIRI